MISKPIFSMSSRTPMRDLIGIGCFFGEIPAQVRNDVGGFLDHSIQTFLVDGVLSLDLLWVGGYDPRTTAARVRWPRVR